MNLYELDDKRMDKAFLKGETVFCKAVLSAKDNEQQVIKEGDAIVVMLSTGAKYKGKILRFSHILIKDYAVCELAIVKLGTKQ